jgi:hypothetical protein
MWFGMYSRNTIVGSQAKLVRCDPHSAISFTTASSKPSPNVVDVSASLRSVGDPSVEESVFVRVSIISGNKPLRYKPSKATSHGVKSYSTSESESMSECTFDSAKYFNLVSDITSPSLRGFVLISTWARKLIANGLTGCSVKFDHIFDPINTFQMQLPVFHSLLGSLRRIWCEIIYIVELVTSPSLQGIVLIRAAPAKFPNALTGCSTNLDHIFDPINIAIRNQIGCAHR